MEATPLLRLKYSWYNAIDYVRLVRLSLKMLLSGSAGVKDLSGPIGIVSTITEVGKETEAEQGLPQRWRTSSIFAALIAVNLAVMNLLPLPALDGGKVFFLIIDAVAMLIFRRRIPEKYENYINTAGFILLMALMLFVTLNDVLKLL